MAKTQPMKLIRPTYKPGMSKLPYTVCAQTNDALHLAEINEWLLDTIGAEQPLWGKEGTGTWALFWDMEGSRLHRGCYRVHFYRQQDATLFALRWL